MSITQADKAKKFRALHKLPATVGARIEAPEPGAFIIPNPWDGGSARILAGLGFEALATTSSGFAFTLGRRDGAATRDEVLAHCRAIVMGLSYTIHRNHVSTPHAHPWEPRTSMPMGILHHTIF